MERKSITISYLELRYKDEIQGINSDHCRVAYRTTGSAPARASTPSWTGTWVNNGSGSPLNWSQVEWHNQVQRDTLQTWGAWMQGAPGVYFELEQMGAERTNIAYWGILKQFSGHGLGKKLSGGTDHG